MKRLPAIACLIVPISILMGSCSSETETEGQDRAQALRDYKADADAVHVADFNQQVGPASKKVRVPADSSRLLLRFDCDADGKTGVKYTLTGPLGVGKNTCDSIGQSGGVSDGSRDVQGEPVVRRGEVLRIEVDIGEGVRWSMSVDLPRSDRAYDRLSTS